jgi:hypothetical protein
MGQINKLKKRREKDRENQMVLTTQMFLRRKPKSYNLVLLLKKFLNLKIRLQKVLLMQQRQMKKTRLLRI